MKKNDWSLLVAVAAYSYLFYYQVPGINYLLLTLLLVGLAVVQVPKDVLRSRSWQITAVASVVTAVNVVVVNTGLAVLGNIVSLILLTGFSRIPSASVFVAAVHGVYSGVGSAAQHVLKKVKKEEDQHPSVFSFAAIGRQQFSMVSIPLIVFMVFLVLYSQSSAAFAHVLSFLNFDFISLPWIFFTLLGGWLLVGFFKPLAIEQLALVDQAAPNVLHRIKRPWLQAVKLLGLKYEYRTGYLLLVLLNVLILVFNLSDSYYLTVGELPEEVSFSEYLHQGVNTLILSILMAIAVLLVLFRGNLNFYSKNKALKALAYLWLTQNVLLVAITLSKNTLYIMEFGLTYKRIGVYTYLTLTAIGLLFSYLKIKNVQTNWYLFRKNAWAVYLVLVVASCINWDRLITTYNLTYSPRPDKAYLLRLSDSNLSILYQHSQVPNSGFTSSQISQIAYWRKEFLYSQRNKDWQSWNYNDWRVAQEL